MILLTSTTDLIQIITGSGVSTINVHASYVDANFTTAAITPTRTNTLITTATTTTVVGSPAASTQRTVRALTVYNSSASSNLITINHVQGGGSTSIIFRYTLLASELISILDDEIKVFDASGNLKVTSVIPASLFSTANVWSALQTFEDIGLNGTLDEYNNIVTVGNGIPSIYAITNLTAQAAAIVATTLYTPPATQRYRVSAYLKVTTVDAVSSTLGGVTLTYTDGTDSVAQSVIMGLTKEDGTIGPSNNGNLTTSILTGSAFIYALTGVPIQFAVAYVSNTPGQMIYAVRLTLEAL